MPVLSLNIADAVMRFSMDKTYSRDKVTYIGIRQIFFAKKAPRFTAMP